MIDAIIGRELDSILVVKCTLVKLVALYIVLNVSVITLKKSVNWGFHLYLERESFLRITV